MEWSQLSIKCLNLAGNFKLVKQVNRVIHSVITVNFWAWHNLCSTNETNYTYYFCIGPFDKHYPIQSVCNIKIQNMRNPVSYTRVASVKFYAIYFWLKKVDALLLLKTRRHTGLITQAYTLHTLYYNNALNFLCNVLIYRVLNDFVIELIM